MDVVFLSDAHKRDKFVLICQLLEFIAVDMKWLMLKSIKRVDFFVVFLVNHVWIRGNTNVW